MNTKLLRQKILDLAIRGKLTDQRKSDGTAANLLNEITKARISLCLSKSTKLKDSGTIIPLDKANAPFEIPNNWEWVKLGDVAYIASGSTPSKDCFVDEGVPYLKMYNLKNQAIDFNYKPQYIKRETHEGKLARSKARPGDVIMNIVGPPLGKVAIIPDSLPECNFNQAAVLIRAHYQTRLMNQYIRYFLLQMGEINSINTKGTAGQENLSLTQSQNMRLPLPPLAEQQRIVEKIEDAFAEIDAVEKNKELLKTHIKQTRQKILDLAIHGKLVPQDENDEPVSVLLEKILQEKAQTDNKKSPKKKKTDDIATSDNRPYEKIEDAPFEIPENWMWVKLGDVLEIARGGSPRPIQDYLTDDENGLNWIKIGDTEKGGKYIESVKEKIKPSGLSHTRAVKAGDFLLTNSMSFGRPYILKFDGCIHDGWLVLGNVEKSLIPDFLYYMLSSDFIYQSFSLSAAGSTVKNLKSETVQATLFPLPPLNEQSRIVSKIEELFSTLDQMERNLI